MVQIPAFTAIDFKPIIVAKDKNDQPFLMIDVRFSSWYSSPDLEILQMEKYQHIPFLMYANSNVMRIFKSPTFEEIARFDTKTVLAFYNPESIEGIIYQSTLTLLIDLWLDDLVYHWKGDNTPYTEEVKAIGLYEYLIDAITEELE